MSQYQVAFTKAQVLAILESGGNISGVYADLAALTTAIPAGNANLYLTLDDGYWNYWTGSAWAAGAYYGGSDGKAIELRKSATHIQWRYVGDVAWTDLVALADIKGDTALTVSVGSTTTSAAGTSATVTNSGTSTDLVLNFTIPQGTTGATGKGITSIARTSGTGAAGTTDTYTITFTDSATTTFNVYNGADGQGSGDMTKTVYDTDNDGKVDAAEVADSIEWDGVQNKPSSFAPSSHTHAQSDITGLEDALAGKSPSSHSHSDYMPLSGGTFTGVAVAQTNTSYAAAQLRNVVMSTADPSGGSNGDIWIKYT